MANQTLKFFNADEDEKASTNINVKTTNCVLVICMLLVGAYVFFQHNEPFSIIEFAPREKMSENLIRILKQLKNHTKLFLDSEIIFYEVINSHTTATLNIPHGTFKPLNNWLCRSDFLEPIRFWDKYCEIHSGTLKDLSDDTLLHLCNEKIIWGGTYPLDTQHHKDFVGFSNEVDLEYHDIFCRISILTKNISCTHKGSTLIDFFKCGMNINPMVSQMQNPLFPSKGEP